MFAKLGMSKKTIETETVRLDTGSESLFPYMAFVGFLYKATNGKKLLCSLTAEVLKREVLRVMRMIEGCIERTVTPTDYVDVLANINVRIARFRHHPLPFAVILYEAEVAIPITSNSTIKVCTHRHASLLTSNQFQVNVQMRVGE